MLIQPTKQMLSLLREILSKQDAIERVGLCGLCSRDEEQPHLDVNFLFLYADSDHISLMASNHFETILLI